MVSTRAMIDCFLSGGGPPYHVISLRLLFYGSSEALWVTLSILEPIVDPPVKEFAHSWSRATGELQLKGGAFYSFQIVWYRIIYN